MTQAASGIHTTARGSGGWTLQDPRLPQVGFLLAIVIVVAIATAALLQLSRFIDEARWVEHTRAIMQKLIRVQALAVGSQSGVRGFVITGEEAFLRPHLESIGEIDEELQQLSRLVADNAEQDRRLDALRQSIAAYRQYLAEEIDLVRIGDSAQARRRIATGQGNRMLDAIRGGIQQMLQAEELLHQARYRAAERGSSATFWIVVSGSLVSVALLMFAYVAVRRQMARRSRSEAAMRETNAFLDTLFENIPHMVFVKSAGDFRYVRTNKAGEALFGRPRSELVSKGDFDLFPYEQAARFRAQDQAAMAAEGVLDVENEDVPSAELGLRTLHTKKVAIRDVHGIPVYLLGITEDVTDRVQAQREIRRLNENLDRRARDLESANRELESFSYSVSHDLRSPLRAIDGFALMLAEDHADRLDEEGRRLLGVVRDNAQRMGKLIDDLLTFSRIGRAPAKVATVDMDALVAAAVRELQAGPESARVQCRVRPLPPVRGEPELLRLVWVNLLGNALKYSGRRERPEVEVAGEVRGSERVYWVRDNGAGFDMRYADKLFGVFQRLHRNDEFPGTGVGLAIVRRIVERHGGRVWAEGKVDQGATFHFALPTEGTELG